jgi:hypothetical protein
MDLEGIMVIDKSGGYKAPPKMPSEKELEYIIGQNFSVEEVYSIVDMVLVQLTDLYARPRSLKFNSVEFHTKKSKMYYIISGLIDLQIYSVSVVGKETVYGILDKFSKEYILEFVSFVRDVLQLEVFTTAELYQLVKGFLITKTKKEFQARNEDPLFEILILEADFDILRLTPLNYKKFLWDAYDLLVRDTEAFYNLYPEYHSFHRKADLEILGSIGNFVYGDQPLNHPLDHPLDSRSGLGCEKEVIRLVQIEETITFKIIRNLFSIIPFKRYIYTSNLEYLKR